MNVVIIDYGAGNIKSLQFAFQRLEVEAVLSNDAETIQKADRVIFPGVGEASSAMAKLKETGLDEIIPNLAQPVLGICLGMQLMCNSSEEGNTTGLGIFDVDVIKFDTLRQAQGDNKAIKIPQIGWNTISTLKSDMFQGIAEKSYMYSVHSYYAPLCKETIAITDYGDNYSSALRNDNFYGVQFHPEKSGKIGEQLLRNFLKIEKKNLE